MGNLIQSKKFLLIGGLVVLLLVSLMLLYIATNKTVAKTPVIDNSPVSLSWWNFFDETVYQDTIADFQKIQGNQNISFKIIKKNNNQKYYQDFIQNMARGTGPDILSMQNDDLPTYLEFLTPIDTFNPQLVTEYKKTFVPLVAKETIIKDKVYGVANYLDNLQMYYNKDLLDKSIVPIEAKTWKEIEKQNLLITKKDNTKDTLGKGLEKFTQSTIALGTGGLTKEGKTNVENFHDILAALILQSGGEIYDYKTGASLLNNSNSIKSGGVGQQENPISSGINFYKSWSDKYTSERYNWSIDQPNNLEFFMQGKLAYILGYSNLKEDIKKLRPDLPFRMEVTNIPQLNPDSKKTYGTYTINALNKKLLLDTNNKNPLNKAEIRKLQKAQEFLYFLSLPQSQRKFLAKTGLPANRYDLINEQLLTNNETLKIFASGSLYADNYYKPDSLKVKKLWTDMFYKSQIQGIPLDQALEEAMSTYNLILETRRSSTSIFSESEEVTEITKKT